MEVSAVPAKTFTLEVEPSVALHVHAWLPEAAPRALVQIAHGMAEHSARYARLAAALVAEGYGVYAADHRGHGKSVRGPEELGFFAEENGYRKLVEDQERLRKRVASEHPGAPIVLLGHSMGSFVVRNYLCEHAEGIAAAVLSGTAGGSGGLAKAGKVVAKVERARLGPRGKSKVLGAMSFGDYNKAFEPVRTQFDWLSRDAAEVDKYVADPLCGFETTTQGWIDVLSLVIEMQRPERVARMSKSLPVYLLSGDQDPVGGRGRGVEATQTLLREAGLSRVSMRLYPGGRHEMFNEQNRDEVTSDLIGWLAGDAGLAGKSSEP